MANQKSTSGGSSLGGMMEVYDFQSHFKAELENVRLCTKASCAPVTRPDGTVVPNPNAPTYTSGWEYVFESHGRLHKKNRILNIPVVIRNGSVAYDVDIYTIEFGRGAIAARVCWVSGQLHVLLRPEIRPFGTRDVQEKMFKDINPLSAEEVNSYLQEAKSLCFGVARGFGTSVDLSTAEVMYRSDREKNLALEVSTVYAIDGGHGASHNSAYLGYSSDFFAIETPEAESKGWRQLEDALVAGDLKIGEPVWVPMSAMKVLRVKGLLTDGITSNTIGMIREFFLS